MVRRFKYTTMAIAVAAVFSFSSLAIAQCDRGGCDSGYAVGAYPAQSAGPVVNNYDPAQTPGCASCSGFGYPSGGGGCVDGGCGVGHGFAGRLGGHRHVLKEHASHLMQIHSRDYARNQAWPKPFDCADRQLYFSIWEPMFESGYRWNCVFTSNHFNVDTNTLNEAGRSKLAGIFKNNPIGQKVALVQNNGNSGVIDARLQNLRSTIDKWYGSNSFEQIALSSEFPTRFTGGRVHELNRKSLDETPPPILPVATGSGSTSDINVGN